MYDAKIKALYDEDMLERWLIVDSDTGYVSATDTLKAMTADTPIDLTIPDKINGKKVTNIGANGFSGCQALKTVYAAYITHIHMEAFLNCRSLTSIAISSDLTIIDEYAFKNCSSMDTICLTNNITSIGSNIFSGCTKLSKIIVYAAKDSIPGAPWGAPNATVRWIS